jgi:hypothetical protein
VQSAAGIDGVGATSGWCGSGMPYQRHDINAGCRDTTGRGGEPTSRQHEGNEQKNEPDHPGFRAQPPVALQPFRTNMSAKLAGL